MRSSILAFAALLTAPLAVAQQSQFEDLVPLPPATFSTQDVDAGDVDGDGDIDLVYANRTLNTIYINHGDLNFVDETQTRFNPHAVNSNQIKLVDLDNDGDLDCVVGSLGANRVLKNDGTGHFSVVGLPRNRDDTSDFAIGDVDGDGDMDILWGDGSALGTQNHLWLQNNFVFTDVTATHLPQIVDPTNSVALADIDNDGDLDALIANSGSSNGQNGLWINDGTGRFIDATVRLPQQNTFTFEVLTDDWDRDGDLDILFVDTGNPSFRAQHLRNDGNLTFVDLRAGFPDVQMEQREAMSADFDGDGDNDIVMTSWNGYTRLILNDGRGNWTLTPLTRTPPDRESTGGAVALDMDDDQDIDIVLGTYNQASRIELNMARQVDAPLPAQIGQSYDIDIYAHAGFITTPQPIAGLIALVPPSWPGYTLSLPPWGNLHIPPGIAISMPPLTVQPSTGGKVTVPTSIPNVQSLVGLKILIQIGVLHTPNVLDLRLSNIITDTIQ